LLDAITTEQGRFWTPDGRRFGFELVDYLNVEEDLGPIVQLINRLQAGPLTPGQPYQVLKELDGHVKKLLEGLCRNTWKVKEPIRAHVAESAANLRDRFTAMVAREAAMLENIPEAPEPSVLSLGEEVEVKESNKVFIGHGRSPAWRELKDFIQGRLHLEPDEFNRVPVAGVPTSTRLAEMLDDAGIAFLILTAEDERRDGAIVARQNVVHEAGLFQGRLGFSRAIVLLEEGCEEFSNIAGLGQIRFPTGLISAVFEEVRRVLERERFL
jgi:hypothetical protein